ncbi:MAG: extracellular solute-binding protein [Candidatus Saccharibacteria bacterium]
MKKYLIIGGILALLVIVVLAAFLTKNPDNGPTGNVELVWWKTFEDTTNVEEMINAYQTAHKGVTIKYVKKDVNTYEQDLVNAIASGNGPDIFTIHNDWLPKHMDKLSPAPATLLTERQYRDAFIDVVGDDFVKDGKIYAMPMSLDVLALYYNRDILNSAGISEPPKTWPELVSDVQKITRQDTSGAFSRSGVALGTSSNVNRAVDILLLLMLQNGTQFYSQNLQAATFGQTQNSPDNPNFNPGGAALQFYTQFANPGKKTYTWNARTDNSVDAFSQGKLAMMISYSYMEPTIKDKAPTLNWGVAPVPQVDSTGLKVNFANYWGEGVSKASSKTKQAAAWDFLKYMVQKDTLAKYYAKHKLVAVRKDMLPDQYSDLDIGVFAENALTARSVYKPDSGVFEGVMGKAIDDVVLRNIDPEEAIRNAAQQITMTLRK